MRHRPSIVLLSALADLLIIGAIVVASGIGPDVLPIPHRLLAAPRLRTVQLPDIPLPPAHQQNPLTPSSAAPPRGELAPVEPPAMPSPGSTGTMTDDVGVLGGSDEARAVERSIGLIDGKSLPRTETVAPPPMPPIHLHSGIEAPRKVRDVLPIYPTAARAAGLHGVVILELTISEQGAVTNARVLRSVPGLDQSALDAVTQWAFAPARLNGQAIPVVMTVTVNFALTR